MAATYVGLRNWSLTRDDEGYRTYAATFLVRAAAQDGPFTVLSAAGLPLPGAPWSYGNDSDPWCWAKAAAEVKKVASGDEAAEGGDAYWAVTVPFTNKPVAREQQRCQDQPIDSPLLEPQKVAGSYSRYTAEAATDRFGQPVVNSAWEQMRGPAVEFDFNRPSVRIEQNVAALQLGLCSALVDCVNDAEMWGLPARTVKLSQFDFEELYYGTCYKYFRRTFLFEINYDTWDRTLLDEGTMALNGAWTTDTRHYALRAIAGAAPDRFNPAHFKRFQDFEGNYARVILNGFGVPAGVCIDNYVPESFDDSVEIYISILGGQANAGLSLRNKQAWIRWQAATGESSFATPPNDWGAETLYKRGNVVTANTEVWIALAGNINSLPEVGNANWTLLTGGLTSQGAYSAATVYELGDYVTEFSGLGTGTGADCNTTATGAVTVEKYNGANFLLLGIPTVLGV